MIRIVPHSGECAGGICTLAGPTLTFAFVVATMIGALFHVVAGGDARRFALFLLAAWLGFALGHVLAVSLGIHVLAIGTLRMGGALIGALAALLLARYLTAIRKSGRNPRTR